MNIQQHAQNILDLCTAGPIQGGISIEIKREAQAIVDQCENSAIMPKSIFEHIADRALSEGGEFWGSLSPQCKHCNIPLTTGVAIKDDTANFGIPDFGEVAGGDGQTFTMQSSGKIYNVLKCPECGYSVEESR